MPKYKTKTTVEHDGKTYASGSNIELTKEQAALMPWAVENGPDDLEGEDKDVAAAIRSMRGNPEHRDSGVQLDWKTDGSAPGKRASEIKPEDVEDVSGSEKPHSPEKEGPRKAPKVKTAEGATKNSQDTATAGKSAPEERKVGAADSTKVG